MKKTLKSYLVSLAFIFLSSFIYSLILAFLKHKNLINGNALYITLLVLSLGSFFLGAMILGIKQESKGLLNGFIFLILYFCLYLISGSSLEGFRQILILISKGLLILIGTVFGVNLKKT